MSFSTLDPSADPGTLICLQLCPMTCPSPQPWLGGSSSSWTFHRNTPAEWGAPTEQGEAYFVNSDTSRWRAAAVGSQETLTFCIVCKMGVCPHSPQGSWSWGETMFSGTSCTKVKCLYFSVWGRERELMRVERQFLVFLAFSLLQETSGISPFCMDGYWRFGWKENSNLKNFCSMFWLSEKQEQTGAGGWIVEYVGHNDRDRTEYKVLWS